VKKRDEGYGYAASDLAAVRDRVSNLHADELLYVVGTPQAQHLEMVYAVARMAGWLPENVRCEHVAFGHVLGPDRKMFKTRSGESVRLAGLVEEAILRPTPRSSRAASIWTRRRAPRWPWISRERRSSTPTSRASVSATTSSTSIECSPSKATPAYLQYAHARLRSIFRRLATPWSRHVTTFALGSDAERSLALGCSAFPRPSTWPWRVSSRIDSATISSISPSASRRSTKPVPCSRLKATFATSAWPSVTLRRGP